MINILDDIIILLKIKKLNIFIKMNLKNLFFKKLKITKNNRNLN